MLSTTLPTLIPALQAANVDATLSSRSAALHREERRLAALAASVALAAKRAELGALLSVDPGWAAEPERREPSPQAAENAAKAIELADQLVQVSMPHLTVRGHRRRCGGGVGLGRWRRQVCLWHLAERQVDKHGRTKLGRQCGLKVSLSEVLGCA